LHRILPCGSTRFGPCCSG